jgi:hypothetical protein
MKQHINNIQDSTTEDVTFLRLKIEEAIESKVAP